MRIFLSTPSEEIPPDALAVRACETLRQSLILSASVGGVINDRGVIFVAPPDVQHAVAVLKRAGIEAASE